ncbi:MAG: hypothetical protein CM15mP98_10860 [Paracoccaceae bacterium]|nr:MAG: hypothetical protein CM15mP98_10860 [Paracoccaceae bacterium]
MVCCQRLFEEYNETKNICIMTSCLADKLLFLNNKCEGIIFKKQNESF